MVAMALESAAAGDESGQVLALDAKMQFDDNALFRRAAVAELRDYAEEDPRDAEAAKHGLNYIALEGSIAVTGAEVIVLPSSTQADGAALVHRP